jgi:hypothetical protein
MIKELLFEFGGVEARTRICRVGMGEVNVHK